MEREMCSAWHMTGQSPFTSHLTTGSRRLSKRRGHGGDRLSTNRIRHRTEDAPPNRTPGRPQLSAPLLSALLLLCVLLPSATGCSRQATGPSLSPAASSGTATSEPSASVDATNPPSPASASTPAVPTATPEPLIRIGPPDGLDAGDTIEASLSADLDGDGIAESAWLVRDDSDAIRLWISSAAGTTSRRQVTGRTGTADVQTDHPVIRFDAVRLEQGGGLVLAVGFNVRSQGEIAWALYRHAREEAPALLRLEPWTAAGVEIRDVNGDGLAERVETTAHVIRIDRYEETADGCAPFRLRTHAANPPDWSDPVIAAESWLFLLYNGIDPNNALPADTEIGATDEPDGPYDPRLHGSIFTAFPVKAGAPSDIAFIDEGKPYDDGLPQAEAVLLSAAGTGAEVRLTDTAAANSELTASVRIRLEHNAGDPVKWDVTEVVPEYGAALCLAEDDDNRMRLTRVPVFLPQAEAATGYKTLLRELARETGIEVEAVRLEGSRVHADLAGPMRLFLNQGSTGSSMRVNTLVRTLLTLPGAADVRVTIGGEADVEMDHFSFRGISRLDADGALVQVADKLPAEPRSPEEAVALLFRALADRDWETLSRFSDPADGTTLGIYGFLEDAPVVWSRMDWLAIPWDDRLGDFGAYDGSGFRMRLSADAWLTEFFVPSAPYKAWQVARDTGDEVHASDRSLASNRWPDDVRITCRWPGTAQYDGMDWRSLTFVLRRHGAVWRLVGLVSNQWTI